jgi:hypothetical protein
MGTEPTKQKGMEVLRCESYINPYTGTVTLLQSLRPCTCCGAFVLAPFLGVEHRLACTMLNPLYAANTKEVSLLGLVGQNCKPAPYGSMYGDCLAKGTVCAYIYT